MKCPQIIFLNEKQWLGKTHYGHVLIAGNFTSVACVGDRYTDTYNVANKRRPCDMPLYSLLCDYVGERSHQ